MNMVKNYQTIFHNDPYTYVRTGGVNVRARVSSRQNMHAHVYASCAQVCVRIVMKNLLIILYYLMKWSLKFHKNRSFRCGDICTTILTYKNHQFSMYFAYFHSFAPPKSSKMENYWITIKIFGNKISKCTYLVNKKTPVPAHRLLCSPIYKQIVFDSF